MHQLINRARSGDPEAFDVLVCEHYARVFRFCVRRVGEADAVDITQEVFLTMQKSIRRYEERSSFSTWLFGIAQNLCRNHCRKRKDDYLSPRHWISPAPQIDDAVVEGVVLQEALGQLSEAHREVVVLHELEELTYAEIAAVLNVPEGTVKSRLHHAFANLRQILSGAAQ